MDDGELTRSSLDRLARRFAEEHEHVFGHRSDGDPVQIVNLRLTALGRRERQTELRPNWWANGHDLAPLPSRLAFFGDFGRLETPILRRSDLFAAPRRGPLIVEEYDATTVVPPDCETWRDEAGNIVIEIVVA
jgi:N-methylhydantoinase A